MVSVLENLSDEDSVDVITHWDILTLFIDWPPESPDTSPHLKLMTSREISMIEELLGPERRRRHSPQTHPTRR